MSDLIINGKDALSTWGVRMGEGFLDAIDGFPSMKPYIENESRLENGKRVITSNPMIDSRQLNLPFTISGDTEEEYRRRRKAFISELLKGNVTVCVPPLTSETYKLVYLGKGTSYALSLDRTFSRLTLKFEEPDPTDRDVFSPV